MRSVGFFAESFFSIGFVCTVIPFEPHDFAVSFESKDMCGDPIKEPSIVATHDRTATELFKAFFQGPECVDVEVEGEF
jgi:hypothetical protein